jgi:hypothetical protein
MTEIITAIGVSMVFTSFFSLTQLPTWLNFKPFNCNVCLSFWVVTLYFILSIFVNDLKILEPFAYGGWAAYFAIITKRILTIL